MRVGNICFSDEFFSTTASVGEVKRTLEDEMVRRSPVTRRECAAHVLRSPRAAHIPGAARVLTRLAAAPAGGEDTVR